MTAVWKGHIIDSKYESPFSKIYQEQWWALIGNKATFSLENSIYDAPGLEKYDLFNDS